MAAAETIKNVGLTTLGGIGGVRQLLRCTPALECGVRATLAAG